MSCGDFISSATALESTDMGGFSVHAAKLVPSVLDRSSLSRMNFTKIEVLAPLARNSGRVLRRAMATTCSEGGQPWPNGPYPRAEGLPHQRGFGRGEDLKQALGDEPELDVAMI